MKLLFGKKLGILGVSLALVLLSGCMGKNNIEEYMRPPKLTGEQSAINQAMEEALGSQFILQYPVSGSYRSAFLLQNLDSDEDLEAIVFYKESASAATMIGVLDREGGEDWHLIYSVAGDAPEVESVSLAHLEGGSSADILVQWRDQSGQNQVLSAYSFNSRRLNHRFSQACDSYITVRPQQGAQESLLVFSAQKKDSLAQVVLIEELDGNLRAVDRLTLSEQITGYQQMIAGTLDTGEPAVYLDVQLADGRYATQVIGVADEALWMLEAKGTSLLELTERYQPIYCRRDAQGSVRIPVLTTMPGYESRVAAEQEYSANMITLDSTGEVTASQQCYISLYGQFVFRYPQVWKEKQITVIWDHALEECIFYEYGGRMDTSSVLLRIKVLASGEALDQFQSENYQRLTSRGQYEYYYYLPNPDKIGPEFNYDVCRDAFSLLW